MTKPKSEHETPVQDELDPEMTEKEREKAAKALAKEEGRTAPTVDPLSLPPWERYADVEAPVTAPEEDNDGDS